MIFFLHFFLVCNILFKYMFYCCIVLHGAAIATVFVVRDNFVKRQQIESDTESVEASSSSSSSFLSS